MIDFRYHIVSLIAVFLALGMGILLGSSVLATGTIDVLEAQQRNLRRDVDASQDQISTLRQERDEGRAIVEQVTPWMVRGRLNGQRFVSVYDGGGGRWRDPARDALVQAGAQEVGSVTLTDAWNLTEPAASDRLGQIVRDTLGSFEPAEHPVEAALIALGRRLFEPDGEALLRALVDARFVTVDGADLRGTWPPRGSAVLGLAASYTRTRPEPGWLAALAQGTASVAPTLIVGARPKDHSAVTLLRADQASPPTLTTFDAAETDGGRSGPVLAAASRIGIVMAMEAAVQGRGGHYGTDDGRRFVPEPP